MPAATIAAVATRHGRGSGGSRHRQEPPARGRRSFAASLPDLLVYATLLVPPFVFLPSLAEPFELPKLLLSEWLGLASLLLLAWRLRGVERVTPRSLWAVPALAAVVPLVAVATAGLATSAHPAHVRAALPDLWIGAACLVGWSVGLSDRSLRRIRLGLLVPAALLALLAVLQFHDLYRPFAFAGGEEAERLGISSLAGNPGVLAAFLVLPALIAQAWLHRNWRRRRGATVAVAVALALCLYGIAVTQTLSAVAAVAAGSALLWLRLLPGRRTVVALGAVVLLSAAAVAVVPALRSRLVGKAKQVVAGDLNLALSGRLDGWRAAGWMLERHPLAGVGHGAYSAEFAAAKLDLEAGGTKFFRGAPRPMFANAHNDLLEVGAVGGLPALAALAWGLWRLLSGLARGGGAHPASDRRADLALAWAGLAGLAVLALFHFPFHVALVAYPAILFLGWSFRLGGEGGR